MRVVYASYLTTAWVLRVLSIRNFWAAVLLHHVASINIAMERCFSDPSASRRTTFARSHRANLMCKLVEVWYSMRLGVPGIALLGASPHVTGHSSVELQKMAGRGCLHKCMLQLLLFCNGLHKFGEKCIVKTRRLWTAKFWRSWRLRVASFMWPKGRTSMACKLHASYDKKLNWIGVSRVCGVWHWCSIL